MVGAVEWCQVHLEDGWHEMTVGRVAPLGPALRADHRAGRTCLAWGDAVICAGLAGAGAFWWRMAVTAGQGGLGHQTRRVVVLGDGAAWIWQRAAHFLGGAGIVVVEILDIFHADAHRWALGRAASATPAVFAAPAASATLAAWVEPLKGALYERGAPAVLDALAARTPRPPDPAAAEVLRRERASFADNAARMAYPGFVAPQVPIGAGAVESLYKTVLEAISFSNRC